MLSSNATKMFELRFVVGKQIKDKDFRCFENHKKIWFKSYPIFIYSEVCLTYENLEIATTKTHDIHIRAPNLFISPNYKLWYLFVSIMR